MLTSTTEVSDHTFIQQLFSKCVLCAELCTGAGRQGLPVQWQPHRSMLCYVFVREETQEQWCSEYVDLIQIGALGKEAQRKSMSESQIGNVISHPSDHRHLTKPSVDKDVEHWKNLRHCLWSVNWQKNLENKLALKSWRCAWTSVDMYKHISSSLLLQQSATQMSVVLVSYCCNNAV